MPTFVGDPPAAVEPTPPGPDPDPPATERFAAPVTTSTVTAPSPIGGGSDDSAALISFIDAQDEGTQINFPASSYTLDNGILLSGRNNIVLNGNGATLNMNVDGDDETGSTFLLRHSSHIQIYDFIVAGNYSVFPTPDGEAAHILGLSGYFAGGESSYVEMYNITADHSFGDFVYLEGSNGGAFPASHHVWVHDNDFDYCGRNGLSLINVTDVWFERNAVDHVNYHAVDFEPNFDEEDVRRIYVLDNDFGSYANRSGLIGFFVALGAVENPGWSDIQILDNTVAGIAVNGYDGQPRGLDSVFHGKSGNHVSSVVFSRNTTAQSRSGSSIFYAEYVDDVTVLDNVQPGAGTFAGFSNCTGVVFG